MYIDGEYVKGSYYLDRSTKYYRGDKLIKHSCYRIDVKYGEVRYRDRFSTKEQCIEELRRLQRLHKLIETRGLFKKKE